MKLNQSLKKIFAISSIAISLGCAGPTATTGECPKGNAQSTGDFIRLTTTGEYPHHVDFHLRVIRFCDSIRELTWWEKLWD